MAFLSDKERDLCQAFSDLVYCNVFLPERIHVEKRILGDKAKALNPQAVWSIRAGQDHERDTIDKLRKIAEPLADKLHGRMIAGDKPNKKEQSLYEDLILILLYHRYRDNFQEALNNMLETGRSTKLTWFTKFQRDAQHYLTIGNKKLNGYNEVAHLFACFFQLRRAFHHIYSHIVGASLATAKLRASIWQSIFTHDIRRYRKLLFNKMGDIPTLITGPTGTGKELVARAIGLSRYIPFDADTHRFADDFTGVFHAVNLSALSPTLIESELFGHRRGSFTGAVADRVGWLEECRQLGTIFLDEIGELDASIQVKLLRVLQSRTFQRLGDTQTKQFRGKIIAATNRDLATEIHEQRFRSDFYYRLCADIITTPSLRDQLNDAPSELRNLVEFLAQRIAGDEANTITDEVVDWITNHLDEDYAWPGNIRELEQCIRNIMIRKSYQPQIALASRNGQTGDAIDNVGQSIRLGKYTADELLRQYCTIMYAKTGSYEAAARKLDIDRRTVKAKIDADLLDELNNKS